jgi:asparagine synthase (glutamine-hydrolysing)
MKKVNLEINLSGSWLSSQGVSVIGNAYLGDKFLDRNSLVDYFQDATDLDNFTSLISSLNGIFSVVIQKDNFVASAIDLTRVYPVFYVYKHDKWYISDNPYSLVSLDSRISEEALLQMRSLDTVFAGKTLVKDICQLEVGEIVEFKENGAQEKHRYFHYNVHYSQVQSSNVDALEAVLKSSVERLVRRAAGRQIVMPLSAGYDSRIVISLLKESGYKNVLTYTMGTSSKNSECHVAKKVADTLGFENYSLNTEAIYRELDLSDFDEYVKHVGAFSNFCWISEYVCVKWLQKNNLIDNDAIVVPGHAGDFFAGMDVTKSLVSENDSLTLLSLRLLYNAFESDSPMKLLKSIKENLRIAYKNGNYPPSLYLDFIYRNRLSSFASNSARCYTFLGYEVAFPLWDKSFLELMRRLPLGQLKNCSLYKDCVERVFKRNSIDFPKYFPDNSIYKKQYIKNIFRSFVPKFLLRMKLNRFDNLGTGALAMNLCKDFSCISRNAKKPFSINSTLSEWYIGTIIRLLNKD